MVPWQDTSSGAVFVLAPAPMLAQLDRRLPVGEQWRYEPKLDGFRGLLWRRASGQVQLLSRNARDLGPWFPELVLAARALEPGTLLDGEMVICDESGWADFDHSPAQSVAGVFLGAMVAASIFSALR